MAKRQKVKSHTGVYYMELVGRNNGKQDKSFSFWVKDKDKKIKWVTVGKLSEGVTAKDAAHLRQDYMRRIRLGEVLPGEFKSQVPYLNVFWEREYEPYASNDYTANTWKDNESQYRNHIKPRFGGTRLNEIDFDSLINFRNDLYEIRSVQTVKHIFITFNKILRYAKRKGYINSSPIDDRDFHLKEPDNAKERYLTEDEEKLLLDTLYSRCINTYRMALVSLATGMRRKEIFNMDWGDIDIKNRFINLAKADNKKRHNSKSGGVRMPEILRDMFLQMKRGMPHQPVFMTEGGTRFKDVPNAYGQTVRKLGLNAIRDNKGNLQYDSDGNILEYKDQKYRVDFHCLRHTFATKLARAGTPIKAMMEIMGHTRMEMTLRYVKYMPSQCDHIVDKIGDELQNRITSNP